MSTDRLTDSLGRSWQTGPVLGRGTWGRSRIVRDPHGREAVLKEPLGRGDFAQDPSADELARACAAVAREQIEALQEAASQPGAVQPPRLEATVELGDGRIGLLSPRYATLQKRLAESTLPVADALRLVQRIAATLAETRKVHGDLKPSNVLFGERGEVYLADACTPTLGTHLPRLAEIAGADAWLPPEGRSGARRPGPGNDTWALARLLWASVADPEQSVNGVDKLAVASARDRAHARFASEGSNPRFRGRLSERLGALLSRGLSPDPDPSPPYRFSTARELTDRVAEVLALVRPKVVDVGRLLPPSTASDGVFVGDAPVSWSVTVGCTPGVADHEDLVCGLQLVDLDAPGDGRVAIEDAGVEVQVHPSGRLRFALSLPSVRPGRYRLRVAFAVKDSGDEPQVALGEFQVRPPPGYVPPPPTPQTGPAPIQFPGRPVARAADPVTEPPSDPGTDPADRRAAFVAPARPSHRPDPVTDPSTAGDPESELPDNVAAFPRPVLPPEEPEEPTPRPPPARPAPLAPVVPLHRSHPPEPASDGDELEVEELSVDPDEEPTPRPAPPRPTPIALPRPPSVPPPPPLDVPGPAADRPPVFAQHREDEELPGFAGDTTDIGGRNGTLTAALAAVVEILRRDRYLSIGVAVAASLFLLLTCMIALKAC